MKKLYKALAIALLLTAALTGCTNSESSDAESTTSTTSTTTTTTTTTTVTADKEPAVDGDDNSDDNKDEKPPEDGNTECLEHIFGEWTSVTEASCSEEGESTRKCTLCTHTESRTDEKLPHSPVTDESKAPTCTATGLTEGSHCSVCGEVITAQETLPKIPHEYGEDNKCVSCGKPIDCAVHTFGEWTQTNAPSCTEEGSRIRICSICLAEETESIAKTPHSPVTDNAVAPTCTATGLTEGSYCSVCKKVLSVQSEIPATDHTYGADNICSVCGSSKESKGLKYSLIGDNYWVAGIGECTDKVVYIPAEHDGKPVIGISGNAFKNCTGIEKIVMYDNIRTIGEAAFMGCTSLSEVVMSPEVSTINPNTFNGCTKLYELDISNIRTIRYSGFAGSHIKELTIKGITTLDIGIFADSHIEKVVFESGTITIPANTFKNTSKLKSVVLPDGITTIGNSAFSGSAIEKIVLPSSLINLNGSVFANCKSLESIDFSNASVRILSGKNFSSCTSLTTVKNCDNISGVILSDVEGSALLTEQDGLLIAFNSVFAHDHKKVPVSVVIPEGVTEIKANAFENCKVISSITFPSTLKTIGDAAFKGCEGIDNIILPDGVTKIGREAFAQSDIGYIYLPDGLTSLSDRFLNECYSLKLISLGKNINSAASVYASLSASVFDIVSFRGTSAEYDAMVTRIGKDIFTTYTVSCTDKDIYKLVKEITTSGGASYVLYSNGTLTVTGTGEIPYTTIDTTIKAMTKKLIISEGITKFAESLYSAGAFEGFRNLRDIEFPSTFTYVGNTFNRTPWIETITTQETVLINGTTLYFASGLKWGYQVPDNIVKIENGAFQYCPDMTSVTLPEGLKEIGANAFKNCTSLIEIEIPEGVEIIGDNAFSNCDKLAELIIPKSVKQIKTIADSCEKLKKITLLGTPESITYSIASYCPALECVIIGEGVTSLPINTLYECSSLKYVVIPASVTSVDTSAFWSCTSEAVFLCVGKDTADHMKEHSIYDGRVYLYSENTPSTDGLYWHYGENNEILIY